MSLKTEIQTERERADDFLDRCMARLDRIEKRTDELAALAVSVMKLSDDLKKDMDAPLKPLERGLDGVLNRHAGISSEVADEEIARLDAEGAGAARQSPGMSGGISIGLDRRRLLGK